jgi:polysaccharide export outer membrane protein
MFDKKPAMAWLLAVRRKASAASAASFLLLFGCGLPHDGPSTSAIQNGAGAAGSNGGYELVELNQGVPIGARMQDTPCQDGGRLPAARPIGLIGPGDLLRIAVWETGVSGSGRVDKAGLDLTLRVEPGGGISLPFAGRVTAGGLTPGQLEAGVVSALSRHILAPQASVLVVEDQTNAVIVLGDVARPGRQALSPGASTLLDVIALSGGARQAPGKELVRVERGGARVTRSLSAVMAGGAANPRLGPGDRVVLVPNNHRFYALGAVNSPGEHAFPDEVPSLMQVLGRIAGLQDNRADPRGLYLFRSRPAKSRIVYHLRLDDPNAFFVAGNFAVRSEDVLFVSTSPVADLSKVLSLITGIGSIGATPRNLGLVP